MDHQKKVSFSITISFNASATLTKLQQPRNDVNRNADTFEDIETIFADRLRIAVPRSAFHTPIEYISWVLLEYGVDGVNANSYVEYQMYQNSVSKT